MLTANSVGKCSTFINIRGTMHKHKLDLAVEAEDTERGNLYISAVHGAKSLENLQAVNIVAVLSVISARELQHFNLGPLYEHGQISHLHIDADDD